MPQGDYKIRMIVEGDHTEAEGYLTVVQPGRKTVLFDIDGTLTLSDFEGVGDYLGTKSARPHAYANEVVWEYIEKGYQIVFLTGRQYWMTKMTREWFAEPSLIAWHLRIDSNAENPLSPKTQAYKTQYLKYLLNTVELDIIRAYGNAATDISAYADAGINVKQTYIIGEHAGKEGTQAIESDYQEHYYSVVKETPSAECDWL